MFTRRQIVERAMEFPGATYDAPFEADSESLVFRHGDTGRWFGLLLKAPRPAVGLQGEGSTWVLNLKCDPLVSYGVMQVCPDIVPAYHMNKQHWISLRLQGEVPENMLSMLLEMSWALTGKRANQRKGTTN